MNSVLLNLFKKLKNYLSFMHSFIHELGGWQIFISKSLGIVKDQGIEGVIKKIRHFLYHSKKSGIAITDNNYRDWLKTYHQTTDMGLKKTEKAIGAF
ncbi:MAG: hypothetical protein U9R19_03130, partial [Bacteroidota bacterium]|nr:hypothetical protein [Bacteroidota bacterium]